MAANLNAPVSPGFEHVHEHEHARRRPFGGGGRVYSQTTGCLASYQPSILSA